MRHQDEFKYEELSRKCGIPAVTIKSRVAKGMSIDEAVKHVDLRKNNKGLITHRWNGHNGVPAIAKALGVSKATVYTHLKKTGGDINKAAESIKGEYKVERASPMASLGLWSTALGLATDG